MRVLSLGWGVQSWALAALSALGVLPRLDYAIHADTGWEGVGTLAFAEEWTPWLESKDIRVITVRASENVTRALLDPSNGTTHIPLYTLKLAGGKRGILRRSCTDRWKMRPQRSWLRAELRSRGQTVSPGCIEQWIGITTDEWHRVKESPRQYIQLRYPLIKLGWSRARVIQELELRGLSVPPKSSCILCPFHSPVQWREVQSCPLNWQRVLEADYAIRHKRPGYFCYLTPKRKPLELCDFRSQEDHGQLRLPGTEKSRA